MSKADDAIVEIDAQLAILGPELEGLQDYARLNIQSQTREDVNVDIGRYTRRITKLNDARASLVLLVDDGHPGIPVQEVKAAVLRDLQAQENSIRLALARFASNEASSVTLTAGEPISK